MTEKIKIAKDYNEKVRYPEKKNLMKRPEHSNLATFHLPTKSRLKLKAFTRQVDVFEKLGAFFVAETDGQDGAGMILLQRDQHGVFVMIGCGQVL